MGFLPTCFAAHFFPLPPGSQAHRPPSRRREVWCFWLADAEISLKQHPCNVLVLTAFLGRLCRPGLLPDFQKCRKLGERRLTEVKAARTRRTPKGLGQVHVAESQPLNFWVASLREYATSSPRHPYVGSIFCFSPNHTAPGRCLQRSESRYPRSRADTGRIRSFDPLLSAVDARRPQPGWHHFRHDGTSFSRKRTRDQMGQR